jgi:hypothetical protein
MQCENVMACALSLLCMKPSSSPASFPYVAVVARRGQLAVIAQRDFAAGDILVHITGEVVRAPTRYTLQVGDGVHIEALPAKEAAHGFPSWRFINHSCAPNVRLRGHEMVAKDAIQQGDEVTFDYDTTEWDMSSPFACECGTARCRKAVRGYRHLAPERRADLAGDLAAHMPAVVARCEGEIASVAGRTS